MKKQRDILFIPDWQLVDYSGTFQDNNQETDGNEEDKEYRFYSFLGIDPNIQEKEDRDRKVCKNRA
jgi:hypothetical protein